MGLKYLVIIAICSVHDAFGFSEIDYDRMCNARTSSYLDESIFSSFNLPLFEEETDKKYSYLKDFKEKFESNSFSYRPFVNVISSSPLTNQLTLIKKTNVCSLKEQNFRFFKNNPDYTKYWKFTFCEEINNLSQILLEKGRHISLSDVTPSFRFNEYIFSWTDFESLQDEEEQNSLFPYSLLDAIKKNNFEIFFQQKEIPDDELHAVYLETLHQSLQPQISKASPMSFTDLATYFLIGGVICLFISKYSNNQNTSLVENQKITRKRPRLPSRRFNRD